MYQPGDVCGATASLTHPFGQWCDQCYRAFTLSFALANSARLSCDCTNRAIMLLSLLPRDEGRGSANYCSKLVILLCCVINYIRLFIRSEFMHYYSHSGCHGFITWLTDTTGLKHRQARYCHFFSTIPSPSYYWSRSVLWCMNFLLLSSVSSMQMSFPCISYFANQWYRIITH